ncbi:WD40 repeat domain-containing protein [Streptomyces sp. GbtcB6]|uniref:WD40 repeat domain-containing protein n=1 Tax=Streptomyces sp. GbtcB6 TaxID=2824751 RepID=UPI001C30AFA7|nr:WD40 repeat domain-containing protein [Streptomyces sp. GbtcB6]
MNVEELMRDALREQAAEQPPLRAGFADQVLAVRRRRRARRLASAAVATAAVVAVAVGVPLLDGGKQDVRPAGVLDPGETRAHPDQSPPRELIGAGDATMAAYYTTDSVKQTARRYHTTRTYWLLNQRTGRYEKDTRWSYVAVAPGLKTAAVLERTIPARRIGLLDLTTGKVARWIQVEHGVGGVEFSHDGRKLVATTYSADPDVVIRAPGDTTGTSFSMPATMPRTGFYVLDVASGKGPWREIGDPNDSMEMADINVRQDFGLSRSGQLVLSGLTSEPGIQYYDLHGQKVPVPTGERYLDWFVRAGLSPDGKRAAGEFAGKTMKTSSWITDLATGKKTEVHGQQLLAWADDGSLIAWDIDKDGGNEFHNRLVLVTIGSDKVVPLSGFRKGNDGAAGRWTPVFAERR